MHFAHRFASAFPHFAQKLFVEAFFVPHFEQRIGLPGKISDPPSYITQRREETNILPESPRAARPGEHTEEALRDWGFAGSELEALRKCGAIANSA